VRPADIGKVADVLIVVCMCLGIGGLILLILKVGGWL